MTSARGITALFHGGPGTGKTLAAGIVARELGRDLYRLDVAQVLSKWVGETERNLAEVFMAAEDAQCILLLDEADSLLARRGEVEGANDRYANTQVNYLLNRFDAFQGIAILTTNLPGAIDPAFRRRVTVSLGFPFPDEAMRLRLWRAHLPPELPTESIDLAALARRYRLSGGYVKNAALRAAFLAAAEGGPLRQTHLERAVAAEFRDAGMLGPSGRLE